MFVHNTKIRIQKFSAKFTYCQNASLIYWILDEYLDSMIARLKGGLQKFTFTCFSPFWIELTPERVHTPTTLSALPSIIHRWSLFSIIRGNVQIAAVVNYVFPIPIYYIHSAYLSLKFVINVICWILVRWEKYVKKRLKKVSKKFGW